MIFHWLVVIEEKVFVAEDVFSDISFLVGGERGG